MRQRNLSLKSCFKLSKQTRPPLSTTAEKNTYSADSNANTVIDSESMKTNVQDALGQDIQRGDAEKLSSPYSNSYVVSGSSDTYETSNYGDANNYLVSGSGAGVGTGAGDTGIAPALGTDNPPAVPSQDQSAYDSTYTNPTETSMTGLFSILDSSPIVSTINGSHITLSGSVCSLTTQVFGHDFALDFCNDTITNTLDAVGAFLVAFAVLLSLILIFA